jgi:hypothetical protein
VLLTVDGPLAAPIDVKGDGLAADTDGKMGLDGRDRS